MENKPTNNQEPKPNTNPNMEGEQHRNSDILARLGALRCLSSMFQGVDHLRQSLAEALDTIKNTISISQGALYNINSYRDSHRKYYSNGLSYKDVEKLKITKDPLFSVFWDPSTGLVPSTSRPHISIY